MKKRFIISCIMVMVAASLFIFASDHNDNGQQDPKATENVFAVFREYARYPNKLMQPNLNTRRFTEANILGKEYISINKDSNIITLRNGVYQISGFSLVSMQDSVTPPHSKVGQNYPGYCMLYQVKYKDSSCVLSDPDKCPILKYAVAIGNPSTALDGNPSIFSSIYNVADSVQISLGHQSGETLNGEVYMSVYEVYQRGKPSIKSNFHLFANLVIRKLN